MQERHVMVPAVYIVMKKDGLVLALERENTGFMDGMWAVPSGHVEKEELPLKGAAREAEEEVGVKIKIADLRLVHTMIRLTKDITGERADFFFEAASWEGEPFNNEPEKHSQIRWVDLSDEAIRWMPFQKYGLDCIEKGIQYSEFKD